MGESEGKVEPMSDSHQPLQFSWPAEDTGSRHQGTTLEPWPYVRDPVGTPGLQVAAQFQPGDCRSLTPCVQCLRETSAWLS